MPLGAFAQDAAVNTATITAPDGVVDSGSDNNSATDNDPIVTVEISTSKTSATPSPVVPGITTITYTVATVVSGAATTADYVLTDTLSAGLMFGSVTGTTTSTTSPSFTCSGALSCTLPSGALPGTYTVSYTATVNADATGTQNNQVTGSGGGDPNPECSSCRVDHQVVESAVTVTKTSNPASGTTVNPGAEIEYTVTVTVANSATTGEVTLTDTLVGAQAFTGTPTLPPGGSCSAVGNEMRCTLAAGSLPNKYDFIYRTVVDSAATGRIGNSVTPGGTDKATCTGACATEHPLVASAVTVTKSSNPASGTTVNPGDEIQYTLTVNVTDSATTGDVTLTDTLSAGQTLGAMPAGCTAAGQVVTCVLPAGSLPNTYTYTYAATVNADATGTISNAVVPSGIDNPTCAANACQTEHPILGPRVTVAKSSDPASGTPVGADATIAYTLTVTVENTATTSPVVLTDTLSGAHAFAGTPTVPAGGGCTITNNVMQCTLATGTQPGVHEFRYSTVVAASASGTVGNNVTATGGGEDDPACTACSTQHPIVAPVVEVSKSADPGEGAVVSIGDTINYTLTVTVANAATTQPVTLTDTPGAGLTIGALPSGCAMSGSNIVCTLPGGTVPGTYTFVYPATINADANGNVANTVAGAGGGNGQPGCVACGTRHQVIDSARLRIVKQASPRDVRIGDLVRYTLTIENVGDANVVDATLIDTPPPGFSFVADTMTVADADGTGRLVGTYPIRVDRLDVRVGERATVQYILRVGAGVRPGTHVNRAHAEDGGRTISNEATAEVQLVSDPLLDESLLLGTAFDDRDGDGWQDSAKLTGVRVQGGFAPGAYVPNSSTIDRGNGPQSLQDASSPLLHGVDVGLVGARQSEADPATAHAVTISQTLSSPAFTDDFVLTSDQGLTVRMDAAGNTRVERSGDAAKGLTAADPQVERRVSQVDGGYRVDYVIGNAGIDERGIPGVRIATVDGLLIETDQYGRFHLEGVAVDSAERGRNFILKVDPATLPPGSVFTTDNPLVRRITQGIPARFDFGIELPSGLIDGGQRTVEMQLGEVMFEPDSAGLRPEDAPVIDKMAEQVRLHGAGEVVITAEGESLALAYSRAQAMRAALLEKLTPEQAEKLTIDLRANPDDPDSTLMSLAQTPVLGTVLFATDSSAIRPEYEPLIERIAAEIERMQGGTVSVTGYADQRGSKAYNAALGLRRAKAVFEAISAKLGAEARGKLRVTILGEPTASVGHGR